MNAKVKRMWLKALRSGEFKQGKKSLRPTTDTFCCLGVLCELYRRDTKRGRWDDRVFFANASDFDAASLPTAVRKWAGLDDGNPTLGNRRNSVTASVLNDRGETFAYIANRIEQHL